MGKTNRTRITLRGAKEVLAVMITAKPYMSIRRIGKEWVLFKRGKALPYKIHEQTFMAMGQKNWIRPVGYKEDGIWFPNISVTSNIVLELCRKGIIK